MPSRPREYIQRIARAAIAGSALIMACWFVALLHPLFKESPAAINAQEFGTPHAPYSDGLGPWLDSSMNYYVSGKPLSYIYRPTVALFYSTIISMTGSIASVPVAWIVLLLASSCAFFVLMDWPHRVVLVGIFAAFGIFFEELTVWLHPATHMVDFWPMAMTFVGIWFIALGEDGERPSVSATATGFLLLGIAGCVRGLPLASGAALLLFVAPGRLRRRERGVLALLVVSFAAPFVVDSIVQKINGTISEAPVPFYSFYSDPQHALTVTADTRYLNDRPPLGEVYAHYFRFLFSPPGIRIFLNNCGLVMSQAARLATSTVFLATLAALAILGQLAGRGGKPASSLPGAGKAKATVLWAIAIAAAVMLRPETKFGLLIFAALVGASVLYGILTGRRLAAMLAVAFCATLAFHAALGLVNGQRLYASYEFLLFASLAAAVCERPHTSALRPRLLPGIAWAALAGILIGYTGNFWIRTGYKASLRAALAAPRTVMKVSNSEPLDRSLYLTNDGYVFYTRYDPLPFGTVRRFRRLPLPEGAGCPTLIHPCDVEWN